jgi:ferredoxin-nitrate reductase
MSLVKKQETTRDYDEVKKTTCGSCPAGCGLKVFLHMGKVVDIFGDEEHPINKGSVCPKGLLTHLHLGHPKRIVTAGIRRATSEAFTQVSWDSAVDYVKGELEQLIEKHGGESVVLYGSESDPFEYLMGANWFARETGLGVHTRDASPSTESRPCSTVERMFGIRRSHLLTNHPRDWCDSKCIILYASDLARCDPITFGPVIDARDRGAALVVIDQHPTRTSLMASMSVIVKPGTQSIFLKGVIRHLIDRNLVDRDFIRRETTGFDALASDLQRYSIERVTQTCRVDASEISRLGDRIGKLWPVQIIAGDWHSRNYLKEDDLHACALLACLRGSIGIAGGGLNFLGASPFRGQAGPDQDADARAKLAKARAVICCGNPFGARPELDRAMAVSDPLVVQLSLYPNTTYQRAHVSIPVSSWMEYDSVHGRSNSRTVQAHRKVVDPPGECRSPLEFWTALACAMNGDLRPLWLRPGGKVNHIAAADCFLKENLLTKLMTFAHLDPEVQKPGGVLWPCIEPADLEFETNRSIKGTVRGRSILFLHGRNYPGSTTRFPTPSGRIEFQPVTAPQVDVPTRYPLSLVMGVNVDFVEDFGHVVNDETLPAPRPLFRIHRQLATAAGVTTGDIVTVKNDLGAISGPARIVCDLDPAVVWCPAGVEPCQPLYPYANPATLFGVGEPFAPVILFKDAADESWVREKIARMESSRQRHSETGRS